MSKRGGDKVDESPATPTKIQKTSVYKIKSSPNKKEGLWFGYILVHQKAVQTVTKENIWTVTKIICHAMEKEKPEEIKILEVVSFLKNDGSQLGNKGQKTMLELKAGCVYKVERGRLGKNTSAPNGIKITFDYRTKCTLVKEEEAANLLHGVKSNVSCISNIEDLTTLHASGDYILLLGKVLMRMEVENQPTLRQKYLIYDHTEHVVSISVFIGLDCELEEGDVAFLVVKVRRNISGPYNGTDCSLENFLKVNNNLLSRVKQRKPLAIHPMKLNSNISLLRKNLDLMADKTMIDLQWTSNIIFWIVEINSDFSKLLCNSCERALENENDAWICFSEDCENFNKEVQDKDITLISNPVCTIQVQGCGEICYDAQIAKNQEEVVFGITIEQLCQGVEPKLPYIKCPFMGNFGISKQKTMLSKMSRFKKDYTSHAFSNVELA